MSPGGKIKVLMASAEAAPFAQVGGLADVVQSLSAALKKKGVDVRVIMPLYGCVNKSKYNLKKIADKLEVPSGAIILKIGVYEAVFPGTDIKIYFVDCPPYFKFKDVYLKGDNSERFLFFSLAALYAIPVLGFNPDVIHCHDSHTALIPDLIKVSKIDHIKRLKTVYTIHNFNYQGKTLPEVLSTGNLHKNSLASLTRDARNGDINFMVQGILNADAVNTVSPSYAQEIKTSAYGAGLERVISKRSDLIGILNGIDTVKFDPAHDPFIFAKYSLKTIGKKKENKKALQRELGLKIDPDRALVGMVSRLVWQKGIDLLTDRFLKLYCQFAFIGEGQDRYEEHLLDFAQADPGRVNVKIKYDPIWSRKIFAAADIVLIPSRFEPCGLTQMIAMRYGAIPVVRSTGGLKDTVDAGVGFGFKDVSKSEFYNTLRDALGVYYNYPDKWRKLRQTAMLRDFSWRQSTDEYIGLYKKVIKK